MSRVWNFSAGPAVLPEVVLETAAEEMLDWHGCGVSVMEMSHRSPEYTEIFQNARNALAELLSVPDTHEVLFMQGGAVGQNAIVPLNLCRGFERAAFINTGTWSVKTSKEFAKYGQPIVVASADLPYGEFPPMAYVPDCSGIPEVVNANGMAYLHYCDNETIGGVEFRGQLDVLSDQLDCPLVADVSSNILSKPINFSKYDLVYGGAQKNIGPAGLTIAIVNKTLFGRSLEVCPSAFDYATVAENGSMFNTPPSYSIYVAGLVFEWLLGKGGVPWAQEQAQAKSKLLYEAIDKSSFYSSPVRPEDRSRMNVPFVLADERLNSTFLSEAKEAGLVQLKGHKSVGGMRASIYNAMPLEGVQALVDFMQRFEKEKA